MALINNDIIKLLNRALKQQGRQSTEFGLTYFCPFHVAKNNVDRRKFGIDISTQKYNCFACGAKGRSFKSLFKKLNLPREYFQELSLLLKDETIDLNFENKIDIFNTNKKTEKLYELPSEFIPLDKPNKSICYRHAIGYVRKRNITDIDILRYNIGYCEDGHQANRVIFPSYDREGRLNFYGGRDFTGRSSLRYLNCNFDKNIIGFESFINFKDEITLVEGPVDAITIRRNCIPLFGKFMSEKLKIKIIESRPPMVNVLLDTDAFDSSIKICEFIAGHGIKTKIIKLTSGKDSNECGFEKTWETIDSCGILTNGDIFREKLGLKL